MKLTIVGASMSNGHISGLNIRHIVGKFFLIGQICFSFWEGSELIGMCQENSV